MAKGTGPQPAGARLTSRQRRIHEQRQRINVVHRQRRRKLLVWFSVIVALLALAIALTVVLVRPLGAGLAAPGWQVATARASYALPAPATVGSLTRGNLVPSSNP